MKAKDLKVGDVFEFENSPGDPFILVDEKEGLMKRWRETPMFEWETFPAWGPQATCDLSEHNVTPHNRHKTSSDQSQATETPLYFN